MTLPTFEFEEKLWDENYLVIGVDEVGRGALAGPVYVGAVVYSQRIYKREKNKFTQLGINDSKQLTIKKREQLSDEISRLSLNHSVGFSTVANINKYGIVKSVQQALRSAVNDLLTSVEKNQKVFLLIDAFTCPYVKNIGLNNQLGIIKGDCKSISIASASIIAKVARDAHMKELAEAYPLYGWEENVGYGTLKHREAIIKYGKTKYHRDLYLRKITSNNTLSVK